MEEKKVTVAQIARSVETAEAPEAYLLDHTLNDLYSRVDCTRSSKRKRITARENDIVILNARQRSLNSRLQTVQKRQIQLERAAKAAEDLPDIEPTIEDPPEATKKKGKKMPKTKQGPNADDCRPCGFDDRLLLAEPALTDNDDETITDENDIRITYDICLDGRRKCARHSG
jgi:hypothetical protein